MAIIYSYPTVTPNSNDLVLLTDTSSSKATKTASVSSLLSIGLAQDINTTKVTVSSAEILDLHNTPIELVASPGANKIIQILSAMAYVDFNSVIYVKKNLELIYTGATRATFEWTNAVLSASGDFGEYAKLATLPSAEVNTAVQLSIDTATANGDSPITIYTTYKTIDV